MNIKYKDLIGKSFGELIVIGYEGLNKQHRWKVKCSCGKEKILIQEYFITGHCKSCGCIKKRTGKNSIKFQGCGEIPLKYFNDIKRRCKKTGREFSITIEYLWDLFLKQNRKCILTNRMLTFDGITNGKQTSSLDRIDSTKGYTKGNVQWVHKYINDMKNSHTQKEFIQLCKEVASQQKTDIITL